jgi:hypothetical protein
VPKLSGNTSTGQHINRERARLTELQYTVDTLHQQELHQKPNANPPPPNYPILPPPLPFNHIPHNQPPSPPHNQYFPSPPQLNTLDDPRKFILSDEAAIALVGGDEATLAKSLIISLEDTAAN